jgi:hypothetical protein
LRLLVNRKSRWIKENGYPDILQFIDSEDYDLVLVGFSGGRAVFKLRGEDETI